MGWPTTEGGKAVAGEKQRLAGVTQPGARVSGVTQAPWTLGCRVGSAERGCRERWT